VGGQWGCNMKMGQGRRVCYNEQTGAPLSSSHQSPQQPPQPLALHIVPARHPPLPSSPTTSPPGDSPRRCRVPFVGRKDSRQSCRRCHCRPPLDDPRIRCRGGHPPPPLPPLLPPHLGIDVRIGGGGDGGVI
jgi:hypothetical protein